MHCHIVAEEGDRVWLAFSGDPERHARMRATTQYAICAGEQVVLVDPGGASVFGPFLDALSEKIALDRIGAIVLSHQDPDVAGSVGLWREVLGADTPIYASDHLVADLLHIDGQLNIVDVPERGGEVPLADGASLHLIPAPYLHSASAFCVYDPVVRVLYSGDIGTSEAPTEDGDPFAATFSQSVAGMVPFHEAWMPSAHARDAWIHRVRTLAVDIMAPHAGPCLRGRDVNRFLDWFSQLDIGVLADAAEIEHAEPVWGGAGIDVTRPLPPADVPPPDPYDEVETSPRIPDEVELEAPEWPADAEEDESERDEDVARLVDALDDDDIDDDEVSSDDEDEDDDDFEIVYVDEDGNEIAPEEVEESDEIEVEGEVLDDYDEQRIEFPPGRKFRLITRSDFDGLVCAVLLEELDLIDDILFVHPNQMQEGEIDVSDRDISTNLPYVPGTFAAFDHHLSEITRLGRHYENHIIDPLAPSAARVVYNYFGGKKRFHTVSEEMMDAVDKGDSAQFTMDEVLDAQDWALLNFVMDSRTGLSRYRGFRVPNYELMMSLIDYCRRFDKIEDILAHPDVKERVDLYREHQEPAKEQIKRCSTVHDNLVVLDYRNEEHIYVVNRFMVYALHPECNISIHVMWGRARQNTVFACGKSIFNRTSPTNIGDLMLTYGGGGHMNAGTCQVDNALSDIVLEALIKRINEDG